MALSSGARRWPPIAKCTTRFQREGIEAFTLHDLRRTCRTGLAKLKVEPHIAERVLGHAQERIRATYDTHAYIDEKRAALEQWSAHLAGLIVRARSRQHFWHRLNEAGQHSQAPP